MPAIQPFDPEHCAPFRHIVDQTPDAVIFADYDGVIRVWNGGAEAVFGFSAAEAVGSSLDIIIAERFRRAHVAVVGIGGVGCWAAECLARSGIGKITMITAKPLSRPWTIQGRLK